jgi:hypothetical protein
MIVYLYKLNFEFKHYNQRHYQIIHEHYSLLNNQLIVFNQYCYDSFYSITNIPLNL